MPKYWKYIFLFLAVSAVLAFIAAFSLPDDKLHLVFCNVGQGDAILIYRRTAQVLVDGGPDKSVLSCLGSHMPFWDRRLELVVLTHPDLDHYGGLVDIFRAYEVGSFAWTGLEKDDAGFKTLKVEVEKEGVSVLVVGSGSQVTVGTIELASLWPRTALTGQVLGAKSASNDYSLVFKLSYGDFSALLTGDIVPPAADIVGNLLDGSCRSAAPRPFHRLTSTGPLPWGSPSRVTRPAGCFEILKVPHHGSKNGLTQGLLDAANPQLAVISVGKNNRYGHPHKEVLRALGEMGVRILRTDLDGEIEVVTDGKSWEVRE